MSARHDKHTLSFTLPISCQICLGKVKSPVLCPNDHVFCAPCMDIWLQKNTQCPACRTPIDDTNPVKQIKGSVPHMDNEQAKMSNPAVRKARLELLFREYEDEYQRLEDQIRELKVDNDRLRQHGGGHVGRRDPSPPGQSDSLHALNNKLADATKLYDRLKRDMAAVKDENSKLKDENLNLNRENERLRVEMTSRSPHRYGRYTVATLESKVDSLEREVRQLTRALEKSDSYIESLEQQLGGKSGGHIRLVDKPESVGRDKQDGGKLADMAAKRQLFGSSMDDLRGLSASDRMSDKPSHSSHTAQIRGTGDGPGKSKSILGSGKMADVKKNTSLSFSPQKSRSPKKVQFALPSESAESISFDLDKPSPLTSSRGSDRASPSDIESKYFGVNKNRHSAMNGDLDLGRRPTYKGEQMEDISDLSWPGSHGSSGDFDPGRKSRGFDLELDDTQTIRSELDDLNISMTPELNDCMKLLNRAEKKSHSDIQTVNPPSQSMQSTNFTSSTYNSYAANGDLPTSAWQNDYYSRVKSNPAHRSRSSDGTVTSLTYSHPLPSSKSSVPLLSSQSSLRDIDDRLLGMTSNHGNKHMDSTGKHSLSKPPTSVDSLGMMHKGSDLSLRSSLPTSSSDLKQHSIPNQQPNIPMSRRSSLDFIPDMSKLRSNPAPTDSLASSRRYSSLTNIAALVPSQSSGNHGNSSHMHKLNQLFPTSSSSSSQSSDLFYSTLTLSGAASKPRPSSAMTSLSSSSALSASQPYPNHASSSQRYSAPSYTAPSYTAPSYTAASYTAPSYTASSYAGPSYSLPSNSYSSSLGLSSSNSLGLSSGKSSEDGLDRPSSYSSHSKGDNYSYVSDASHELSSRASDMFLSEPKKRLFDSTDDLDITGSPNKSSKIY